MINSNDSENSSNRLPRIKKFSDIYIIPETKKIEQLQLINADDNKFSNILNIISDNNTGLVSNKKSKELDNEKTSKKNNWNIYIERKDDYSVIKLENVKKNLIDYFFENFKKNNTSKDTDKIIEQIEINQVDKFIIINNIPSNNIGETKIISKITENLLNFLNNK